VFGALRTALSVAFIASMTWFAFSVDLGPRTFAEHVDRISETDEAQDLLQGARERVNPALEEAKQRVLGEHIEAPTQLSQKRTMPARAVPEAASKPRVRKGSEAGRARPEPESSEGARASDASSTRLPGQR
jgi:hypothetical protein